jgi:hypothetical protein
MFFVAINFSFLGKVLLDPKITQLVPARTTKEGQPPSASITGTLISSPMHRFLQMDKLTTTCV